MVLALRYELIIRSPGGGHITPLTFNIFSGTFHLRLIGTASTIPAINNLTGGIATTQPKCQTSCQGQCPNKTHKEGVDQRLSHSNLVHGDDNTEGPDRHTCDGCQQIRVAETRLSCGTTH